MEKQKDGWVQLQALCKELVNPRTKKPLSRQALADFVDRGGPVKRQYEGSGNQQRVFIPIEAAERARAYYKSKWRLK